MSLEKAHCILNDPKKFVPSLAKTLEKAAEQADPMLEWFSLCVQETPQDQKSFVLLGAVAKPAPTTLYGSFVDFCKNRGLTYPQPRSFPNQFQNLLASRGLNSCQLVRRNAGWAIINLKLVQLTVEGHSGTFAPAEASDNDK